MRILPCALALLLVPMILLAGCGKDDDGGGGGGRELPGVLTRAHPGEHEPDEARALEPRLVLVRGASTWLGRLEASPPDGTIAERLELVGPEGEVVVGMDLISGAIPEIAFTLPLTATGTYLARVRYSSGETWAVETTL